MMAFVWIVVIALLLTGAAVGIPVFIFRDLDKDE